MSQVPPGAHVQPLRQPANCDSGFSAQLARELDFPGVTAPPGSELILSHRIGAKGFANQRLELAIF